MPAGQSSYELSANQIDTALRILHREQKHNTPSGLDRILYLVLTAAACVFVVSLLAFGIFTFTDVSWLQTIFLFTAIAAAGAVVITFFLFTVPLARKTWRQIRLVRRLGLSSVASIQWQRRRRENKYFVAIFGSLGVLAAILAFAITEELASSIPWYVEIPLFLFVAILLLVVTGFIRRRKERLETLSNIDRLIGTFSEYQTSAEKETSSIFTVPTHDVEAIAGLERSGIRRQRIDAIANLDRTRDKHYSTLKSAGFRRKARDLETMEKLRVEAAIGDISRNATTGGVVDDPATAAGSARVSDTDIEIEFRIDDSRRSVTYLDLKRISETMHDRGD